MNEPEFLQRQLAIERRHLDRVCQQLDLTLHSRFDAATLQAFCAVAAAYIGEAGARRARQLRSHVAALGSRLPAESASARATLSAAGGIADRIDAGLAALAASANSGARVDGCRQFLSAIQPALSAPAADLDALLQTHYTLADWRSALRIDADSILRERTAFAAVAGAAPPGIALLDAGA